MWFSGTFGGFRIFRVVGAWCWRLPLRFFLTTTTMMAVSGGCNVKNCDIECWSICSCSCSCSWKEMEEIFR